MNLWDRSGTMGSRAGKKITMCRRFSLTTLLFLTPKLNRRCFFLFVCSLGAPSFSEFLIWEYLRFKSEEMHTFVIADSLAIPIFRKLHSMPIQCSEPSEFFSFVPSYYHSIFFSPSSTKLRPQMLSRQPESMPQMPLSLTGRAVLRRGHSAFSGLS